MADTVELVTVTIVGIDQNATEQPAEPKRISLQEWFNGPTVYLKPGDQRPWVRDKYGNEVCLHGIVE
jgi:hypothetical protein